MVSQPKTRTRDPNDPENDPNRSTRHPKDPIKDPAVLLLRTLGRWDPEFLPFLFIDVSRTRVSRNGNPPSNKLPLKKQYCIVNNTVLCPQYCIVKPVFSVLCHHSVC